MTKKIVFTADVVHKLLGVREAQQAPAALMKISWISKSVTSFLSNS
jgi:hypothetical protein